MKTIIKTSKEEVFQTAVTHIESSLRQAVENGKHVLFLPSGGSNIELLTQLDKSLLHHSAVTIFPFDERFDSGDQNNSLQIQRLSIPIRTMVPRDAEGLREFGERYHQFLDEWMKQHPDGVVIAIIGIGPDGHVAGISPGDETWFDRTFMDLPADTWAVGYEGYLMPPKRVTVTPQFIQKKIDEGIIVATGSGKAEALRQMRTVGKFAKIPARLLNNSRGTMTLYTDQQ
jgi:6-phosphogluconolactonase/glucosamine-6-phosphate isomerase/deaminase